MEKGEGDQREDLPYFVLQKAFLAACEHDGFRLVQYCVMDDHLHLIVEGKDRESVSRGLQGLFIRIARGLNKIFQRTGKLFADRYHDRILRTPREVWNALRYVLHNARRHGIGTSTRRPDPFTSGHWFEGWRDYGGQYDKRAPIARAHTWLLQKGWRKHGRLRLTDVPAG